jgi:hypothetical protein
MYHGTLFSLPISTHASGLGVVSGQDILRQSRVGNEGVPWWGSAWCLVLQCPGVWSGGAGRSLRTRGRCGWRHHQSPPPRQSGDLHLKKKNFFKHSSANRIGPVRKHIHRFQSPYQHYRPFLSLLVWNGLLFIHCYYRFLGVKSFPS